MSLAVTDLFEIASGSVAGRTHLCAGKGSQDACAIRTSGPNLVAVVCDGCGSAAHSEVGAWLGARLVIEGLQKRLARGARLDAPELWEEVRREVLAEIERVSISMGGSLPEAIAEHFLFTVVGLAIAAETACVFSAGDGLFAVGGDVTRLGPFPRNEPPYLAYGLLGASAPPRLSIHRTLPASEVRSLLIGTDGALDLLDREAATMPGGQEAVGPIAQFWTDDRYFRNRDAVRRRLALINREVSRPIFREQRVEKQAGLLPDDTTLVVLRRRRRPEEASWMSI